ncbi:hypothetical protein Bca4012_096654 [Brassica carinata]|uniref:Uncharacterized protein n=1 Tax=Brassica carinata TaxID=52824 RepID=A0A8X7PWI8_BRACI|nr:hypothetical protein Bca52824_078978 [Brassica carinata]
MTGPTGSKPAREIFLTSSSLSFSSFSSSCASSDDDAAAIELNIEAASPTSRGKLLKASSRSGSEMSCLTHVTMQPAPSPPSKFRPRSPYDPERIPASVFGKKAKDVNWSDESLFSLRMSNYEGFRQSNLMPGDVLMPGEFLAYSPSLKVKPEDAEEEMTQVETNNIRPEMSLSPTPSTYSYPTSFAQLYQAQPPVVPYGLGCFQGFQSADVTYVAATDGRNVAAAVANEFFILPLQGADLDKPSIMTLKS